MEKTKEMTYLKNFCDSVGGRIEGRFCVVGDKKFYQFSSEGGIVQTTAHVSGEAKVSDNARVFDKAWIFDNARVSDNAQVFDKAWIFDNARVSGNAQVFGNTKVSDNAQVSGNALVFDNAWVTGNAVISGNAKIGCHSVVEDIELDEGYYCSPDKSFIIDTHEKAEKVRKFSEKFKEIIETIKI